MKMCSSINDSDIFSPQNVSSEKLIFYKEIKTKYEPEGYLSSQKNISLRKELTKLRISNHEIMIERGRYHSPKIPREERLCQICKNKVEDEKHFIFKCILYDVERKNLELWFNNFLNVDLFGLSMEHKLELLFISDNPVIYTYISDFVLTCIKKR